MDNEWLKTAIRLAKLGKKQEAQEILHGLVKRDPADYHAWLWLADTMPTREGRVGILREALLHNPNNKIIRQALTSLGADSSPPPTPAKVSPDEFPISMDDLQALDQRIDREVDNAPEVDWLRALGEPSADASAPREAKAKPEVKPDNLDARQPEPEIKKTGQRNHAADFLDLIHRRDEKVAENETTSEPAAPVHEPLEQSSVSEEPGEDKVDEGVRVIDGLEIQIEDSAPRRRWLGIVFVVVLLAILAVAVYVSWPTIWGTISPMISALSKSIVVEPTLTPTATLSPTPTTTPTNTSTPRPTNTIAPTPSPTITLTPIPPLVIAAPVSPDNIQQFKSLGMVPAQGAVSLSAHLLAETVDEKSVRIWDFVTGNPQITLTGPAQRIQQSAISPDGKSAAAVSEAPAVWVWDIETGQVAANLEFSLELASRYTQPDFPKTLQIQFSPDGKAVFVSSMMGITWWDLATKQEHHLFPLLPKEYEDFRQVALQPDTKTATSFLLAFSPDGKTYAVGSQTKVYIQVWPGAGGVATLNTDKPLIAMHWMNNGLLGLVHPGEVSVWNTYLNKQMFTFSALKSQPSEQPPAAAFQLDGQRMAVEVDSTRNVPGGMMLVSLPGGEDRLNFDPLTFTTVTNPIFSVDGSILFGSSGGDLFVWETATGKLLRRIANRNGFIEMSLDGKFYLEVESNGTSIWGSP